MYAVRAMRDHRTGELTHTTASSMSKASERKRRRSWTAAPLLALLAQAGEIAPFLHVFTADGGAAPMATASTVGTRSANGQSPPLARNPFAEIPFKGVVGSHVRTTSDYSGCSSRITLACLGIEPGPQDIVSFGRTSETPHLSRSRARACASRPSGMKRRQRPPDAPGGPAVARWPDRRARGESSSGTSPAAPRD